MNDIFTRRSFCAAGAAAAAFGFNRLARGAQSDPGEAITQLATFRLNKEKAQEGLDVLEAMCAEVEKNEPGVLVYICSRSAKNPDELVFFEVYKDAAALKEHATTPHLAKLRKAFGTLLLPPLEITRLERVGGFARG